MLAIIVFVMLAAPAQADLKSAHDAYNRGDYAMALKDWKPFAERGYPSAQFLVAHLYLEGLGVPRDYGKAAKWLRMAAEQGYPGAQALLGDLFAKGRGV